MTLGIRRSNDAKKKRLNSKVIDKMNIRHVKTIGADDQGGNLLVSMNEFFERHVLFSFFPGKCQINNVITNLIKSFGFQCYLLISVISCISIVL